VVDCRFDELAEPAEVFAVENGNGRIVGQLLHQISRPQRDVVLPGGASVGLGWRGGHHRIKSAQGITGK
jgi:hypothetical protein